MCSVKAPTGRENKLRKPGTCFIDLYLFSKFVNSNWWTNELLKSTSSGCWTCSFKLYCNLSFRLIFYGGSSGDFSASQIAILEFLRIMALSQAWSCLSLKT